MTLTVISVMAATATASVAPVLHAASGRSATQQLASDLRLTRMKAIAQNTRYRVSFDDDGGSYVVERETSPGTFVVDEGPFVLSGSAEFGTVAPANPIFDTRGGASAFTTINVQAADAPSHAVTINQLGIVRTS